MKKTAYVLTGILLLSMVSTVFGESWRGSGGWGMKGAYQRVYDPATAETIRGEVIDLEKFAPMKGMRRGIHLMLKTDKETIPVHLGPDWFIERLDTKIEKGDRLEIKGSRVTLGGKPAIIAAELKKGESVLILRDSTGVPVWSGWRR